MTRHTRFLRTRLFNLSSAVAPAVMLALALGVFATPAQAGHNDGPRGSQVACGLHDGGPCTPACGFGHRGPYSRNQFDKGFYVGEEEGLDAGFRAGRYGRRFCDIYPYRLGRHNRFFRQGVLEGFSVGYLEGYEEGRKQRFRNRGRGRGHGRGRGRGHGRWHR